jgi:hypothetical protein
MMIQRSLVSTMFAVCVCGAFASPASADSVGVNDSVTFADGPGTTGGGEFLVTINNLEQFITFCLQRTEYIDFSTAFVVDGVSTYAMTDATAQGGDAITGHDLLSPQTAWLYTQFRANTLTGYDYAGATRWQSANALQNAIWWFEGELPGNPNNLFVSAANDAVAAGWTGLGNVRVMNLRFPDGREAQDQLVLVPEPATLALLGVGMVWAVRRRRTRVTGGAATSRN